MGQFELRDLLPYTDWGVPLQRAPKAFTRQPLGEEQETEIRWGKPSDFPFQPGTPYQGPGFQVQNPHNPTSPTTPPNRPRTSEVWQETGRNTHDKRVENPDDSEQYVIVEVIDDITFSTPRGFVQLKLNNPSE